MLSIRRSSRSRLAQYSTKATANYEAFKKLRAYPFTLTPDEAQTTMSMFAVPFARDLGLLSSFWAVISSSIRPVRFSAAYFPAWIVNAEVEADLTSGDARVVTEGGQSSSRTSMYSTFPTFNPPSDPYLVASYLPGSHVPTLSAAPLWSDDLNLTEPVPCIFQQSQLVDHIQNKFSEDELHLFDPSLLKQHGEEVQCIPFTTSPFSLLDIARKLPWNHAVINENLKFAPSSLKVNLFSAFPVLLPLYIAKYEVKSHRMVPGTTITMWTVAHDGGFNLMTDNFAVKFFDKRIASIAYRVLSFFGNASPDEEVISVFPLEAQGKVGMVTSEKALTAIDQWLTTLRSSTNISRLTGTIDNDNDPRIRPMIKAEQMDLKQYFDNEREILIVKRIIEELKSVQSDAKVEPSSFERASATLQEKLDSLLTKKEDLKPQWWTEWELIQSQEPPS